MTYRKVRGSSARFAARFAGCVMASVLVASAAMAAPAPKVPPVDQTLMRDMVKTLASDALEGRGPSTAVEPKVLDAIIARFKQAGLQPGNKGGWLQDVPTVEVTAGNVSPLVVTGAAQPLTFTRGKDFVAGSYRITPKTDVRDSELVFVGYGVNAPELGWNDYAGVDVKGKTVVILVNDPDYETATEDGPFKGRRMTYYGRWTYKFEEAARQGATAAIIVHDTVPAAYGWNVVQSSWTGPQQVADGKTAYQSAAIGWISNDKAKALFAAAGQDLARLSAAAKRKGFKAVPLGTVKASVSFDNAVRRHMSKNVVALLPGTTAPERRRRAARSSAAGSASGSSPTRTS